MSLPEQLRQILKFPLRVLVDWDLFRSRAIFEFKRRYYGELGVMVPLGRSLNCPVASEDAWWSFKEIFIDREYAPAFEHLAPPARWLDLGCHVGYFSLFVVWMHASRGSTPELEALLVDGDSRVASAVDLLIRSNSLRERLRFAYGVISAAEGEQQFVERGQMSSALAGKADGDIEPSRTVPRMTEAAIMELMAPPYDLIKVDVEGAEFDLLSAYPAVMAGAGALLIEWHDWRRGRGREELVELLSGLGFTRLEEIVAAHDATTATGEPGQCGVLLARRPA